MDHRQTVIACELHGADLCVVDALVRLRLGVRRRGGRLQVRAGDDLAELLALTGLTDVLLQPVRQPEPREERWCVEEVVQVDEPPV